MSRPTDLDGSHLHVLDLAIAEVKDSPRRREYLEQHWPGVLDQLHDAVLDGLRDNSARWHISYDEREDKP